MFQRGAVVIFSLGLLVVLSGCASFGRKDNLEMQGLKNQVSLLESQIQSKDDEINSLRDQLSRQQESYEQGKDTRKKKVIAEVKSRPNVKQIQMALKNAGYDPGVIDGRMGARTREAIKAFQRANDLQADGSVGKKTWELLKDYLYKKVK